MDWLIYVAVLMVIGLVCFGGVWLKRKFNIKDSEIEIMRLILKTVNYISSKFEYKYQNGIGTIVRYSFLAIAIVEEFDDTSDIETKMALIKDKTAEICIENGIQIDTGIVEIIDEIVEFAVRNL